MTSRARLSALLLVVLAASSAAACTNDARGAPTTATSATTTSSTVPRPTTTASTTTTTSASSIAQSNAAIAAWAASREGLVQISIGDLADGTVTDITPGPQLPVRIASVMKVSIGIQFLRLRKAENRPISANEIVQLGRMIQISDNGDADDLWDISGRSAGLSATTAAAKMTQTATQPGRGWGFSLTTAHDQALLTAALAQGRLLDDTDTRLLLGLMRNVQPDQRWGFADVIDPSLEPAVKNGWYRDGDEPVWRVHCVAIFDRANVAHPFSIAVMTKYPTNLGMSYGQDTCRGVAHLLGARLIRK